MLRQIAASPATKFHSSARLKWYCQESRAPGATSKNFGLSFCENCSSESCTSGKKVFLKFLICASSKTKKPPHGRDRSWLATEKPASFKNFSTASATWGSVLWGSRIRLAMDLRFKKAKLAFFIVPTKACQQIGASAKKALPFLI